MTEVYQISRRQVFRSARSYLRYRGHRLAGSIEELATKRGNRYYLYRPASIDNDAGPDRLIIHLHGAKESWDWVGKEVNAVAGQLETQGLTDTALVAPFDPTGISMWADANTKTSSAVLDDVLPTVITDQGLKLDQTKLVVQGFSMGGFGAATMALRNHKLFDRVIVWDGAMHDWETLTTNRPKIAGKQFNDSQQDFDDWSPWKLAGASENTTLPFLVVSGAMSGWADLFHDHLISSGFQSTRVKTSCPHSMPCMANEVAQQATRFLNGQVT